MSLVEAVANVVVGLVVVVATQIVVFPVLGLQASLGQNLRLAAVFTGVSIARSYALRRLTAALLRADTCVRPPDRGGAVLAGRRRILIPR